MSLSQGDCAYERIRDDIVACILSPGQRVTSAELTERYQIGATPVREALVRLSQEKLVKPYRRFGYVVSPIDVGYVQQMFELRAILELPSARLAALRASEEQIRELEEMARFTVARDPEDRETRLAAVKADADFHMCLARASGNQRLADLIAVHMQEMSRIRYVALKMDPQAEGMRFDSHVEIAQATRARDPDRAARAMHEAVSLSCDLAVRALTLKPDIWLPGAAQPAASGVR
jgi:DNA-binding GntR family transcriptional regulator